jgi:UDP-N-acetylmuramoyl-L-alanyl-D-glutamate--2,6-diaminopimelate ligase
MKKSLGSLLGGKTVLVSGITDDSRKVKKNFIFVAIKGLTVDGHQFILQAIKNGAKVVIGEEDPKKLKLQEVNYFQVGNSRKALGLLAAAWYGNPTQHLKVIGVTGTDGKTTTASMIYHILKESGKKVGLICTVNAKIGGYKYDTGLHVTNPEPLALQKFLAKMVKEGCEYAVLEVTSHGLDQERVAGIDFDIGVLTNITHEHLDYHKTFTAYKKAKLRLFQNAKVAVLNKNDKSADWIKKQIAAKVIFYRKDLLAKKRFIELYNQENASAAIAVARYLKISPKKIDRALQSFPGVEGRMQEVKNKKGIKIIIDFAHTPNGLKNVLEVLSKNKKGRLIAVIACEGERDRQKRSMMAEIAGKIADILILNAIDIRSEKAKDIISDMEKGIKKSKGQYFKIEDRAEAIAFALKQAQKGDTVVLCGKGHEKTMAYAHGIEKPWSDKEVVKRFI